MNDNNITITPRSIIFWGIGITIAIGLMMFFLTSSNKNQAPITKGANNSVINSEPRSDFLGEKGTTVKATDEKIYIKESNVNDGDMHSFNYFSDKEGKTIYFFIVKASDRTYRAAANACEVCFDARKGFKQVGNLIRCENCQTTYSKDKIALEKGGCNPGPIDKDVLVENGKLVINVSDIEETSYLF